MIWAHNLLLRQDGEGWLRECEFDEFISAIVDGFIDRFLLSYYSTRFRISVSAEFLRFDYYEGQG